MCIALFKKMMKLFNCCELINRDITRVSKYVILKACTCNDHIKYIPNVILSVVCNTLYDYAQRTLLNEQEPYI